MTTDRVREIDVVARLLRASVTGANDDTSKPMTHSRSRHIERVDAMLAAASEIETLRARVKELEQRNRAAGAFWKAMARRFSESRRSTLARAESAERKLSELTQR